MCCEKRVSYLGRGEEWNGPGVGERYVDLFVLIRYTGEACPPPALLHQHISICSVTDLVTDLIKLKKNQQQSCNRLR